MRFALVLLLVACGSSSSPVQPPSATAAPQPREVGPEGVFMTPRDETNIDLEENQLYVSLWQEGGDTAMSLLCQGPCLPNVKKQWSDAPEGYRSDHARQVEPRVWEAKLAPNGLLVRVDLRAEPPAVQFGGRTRELRRMSFSDAGYHLDDRDMDREALLFITADQRELFIKPGQTGSAVDDSFLYLAAGDPRVHTMHSRHWHYQLLAKPDPNTAGAYFAVLHGEVGDAEVDLDIVRSPESDLAFLLSRVGKPKLRFSQTNDSNTHRFEHCTPGHESCEVLFIAEPDGHTPRCPNDVAAGWLAILLDPAGTWRMFIVDGKDQLLDQDCNAVYRVHWDDTKAILRDPVGVVTELTARSSL